MKGWLFVYKFRYKDAVEIGERVYQKTKELNLISETIEALLLKAYVFFHGKIDQSLNFILKAEKKLNSIMDKSSLKFMRLKMTFLSTKSWVFFWKAVHIRITTEIKFPLELTLKAIELGKNLGNRLLVAFTYLELGWHHMDLQKYIVSRSNKRSFLTSRSKQI